MEKLIVDLIRRIFNYKGYLPPMAKPFTDKYVHSCINIMFKQTCRSASDEEVEETIRKFNRKVGKLYNRLFKEAIKLKSVAFNTKDSEEIFMYPEVERMRTELKTHPSRENIQKLYKAINNACKALSSHNTLAKSFISGSFKEEQFYQLFGARGFASSTADIVYDWPISTSYYDGMISLYDLICDSQGYMIALKNSTDDIAMASATSKKSSFPLSAINRIIFKDCGNDITMDVELTEHNMIEYVGMLHKVNGKFIPLDSEDTHMIGEIIKVRNPVHCRLEPHKFCSHCIGELSYTVTPFPLGRYINDVITVGWQQSKLSAKHLIVSATIAEFEFENKKDRTYFKVVDDNLYVNANDEKFYLNKAELSSIFNGKNDVTITYMKIGTYLKKMNPVKLTDEFIEYIKDNIIYIKTTILININTWNPDIPIGTLIPMINKSKSIDSLLSSVSKGVKKDPITLTRESLESLRGMVGFSFIELFIFHYAYSRNKEGYLSKGENLYLQGSGFISRTGSLSDGVVNSGQLRSIYSIEDRIGPDSPLDDIFF